MSQTTIGELRVVAPALVADLEDRIGHPIADADPVDLDFWVEETGPDGFVAIDRPGARRPDGDVGVLAELLARGMGFVPRPAGPERVPPPDVAEAMRTIERLRRYGRPLTRRDRFDVWLGRHFWSVQIACWIVSLAAAAWQVAHGRLWFPAACLTGMAVGCVTGMRYNDLRRRQLREFLQRWGRPFRGRGGQGDR